MRRRISKHHRVSERRSKSSPTYQRHRQLHRSTWLKYKCLREPCCLQPWFTSVANQKRSSEQIVYIIIEYSSPSFFDQRHDRLLQLSNPRTAQHVYTLRSNPLHIHPSHNQRAFPCRPSPFTRPLVIHTPMPHRYARTVQEAPQDRVSVRHPRRHV